MGGSLLLFGCLMAVLALWYWSEGSVSVATVNAPKAEAFYWAAITFSQTLGTALGDWTADAGLGYGGAALVFAAGLAVLTAAYYWTNVSRVTLFWAAFILTRPLGATVGDFLDKPLDHGGLALSRPLASLVLAVVHDCLRAAAAAEGAFILDRLRPGEASRRLRPISRPAASWPSPYQGTRPRRSLGHARLPRNCAISVVDSSLVSAWRTLARQRTAALLPSTNRSRMVKSLSARLAIMEFEPRHDLGMARHGRRERAPSGRACDS